MAVTKKLATKAPTTTAKAELPKITDEIFKLKIDRETQKFFIEGLDKYGQFEELILRPLDIFNKIVAYNDEFEIKSESTLYRELKDATDSQGNAANDRSGKVCGRIIWKNMTEKLSEDEKQHNKEQAKFYALVFGVADIKGQEPLLVDFRIGGSKFMEIINILKKIKEDKTEYNRAEIKLKAFKNEEFDWPEIEIQTDFSRDLPLTGLEPLFDTVEGYVEYHNADIEKKAKFYQDKKAGKTGGFKRSTSFKKK